MRALRLLAGLALATLPAGPAASAPTLVQRLENGLQVAVFRDARLPVVQILVVVPAGTREEGPFEAGAARMTALLLIRGTSSRSASEYAVEVERLGGTVAGRATPDFATLSGAFRAADLARGIELIADGAINPIFDDAEVGAARSEMLRVLLESRRHLGPVADEHLWARALKGQPYAMPENGTPESVAALTRARILGFHRARYRPDRALLGIAGDVDPERALALAREHFGGWSGRVRGEPASTPPAPPQAPGIRLVDVPGAPEAEIRIGLVLPGRNHEDAAALTVANELLGGGPRSRLSPGPGRLLRTFSSLQLYRDGGLLALGTAARNDSVPAVIERLRRELVRLVAEPLSEREVEASRRALSRSFPIQNEPLGVRSLQWLVGELLGLGPDDPDRHPQRIAAVTAAAVRAAAARWLDAGRAEIVVVGDASALRPALEKLGTVEVVSIQSPAVAAAVPPAMRLDEPDAAALEQGRKMVERLLAAHGGLARLKEVKDSRVEAEVTLYSGEQSARGRQVELRREPGRLRVENVLMELATVQALDGDEGWSRAAAGEEDSIQVEDAEGVAGLKHLFASDVVHVLLAAADPRSRVAHRGRDEVGTTPAEVIEVVDPAGARRVLFLDPVRHRLLAIEENEGSVLRGPVLRRTFGQLKTVQGILWPHTEERLLNGTRTMTLAVEKVELNTGISEEAFKRPKKPATGHRRR